MSEFHNHPAVLAWNRLAPSQPPPTRVEPLKQGVKSWVFRLVGAGGDGTDVIGKLSRSESTEKEHFIYSRILTALTVSSLRSYGTIPQPNEDGQRSWLFTEDAGGRKLAKDDSHDRVLAATWLARVHIQAADVPELRSLPARGAEHYRDHLRSARHTIVDNLGNAHLTDSDRDVLRSICGGIDQLEGHWAVVDRLCANMPKTLVHGDFAGRNLRVRPGDRGWEFVAVDWEMAGVGVPAADLQWIDLDAYWSEVRAVWKHCQLTDLSLWAELGRLLRLVAKLDWASTALRTPWTDTPMHDLPMYHAELAERVATMFQGA